MAATIRMGSEWITIELSGLNYLSVRKHVIRIPMAAVTTIRDIGAASVDHAPRGVATPLTGVRSGIVERDGKTTLLVYRPGHPTYTVDLDRTTHPEVPYDSVVLSVELDEIDRSVEGGHSSLAPRIKDGRT